MLSPKGWPGMKKPEIDRNKTYSSSEIIGILETDGRCLHGSEGSHYQFKNPEKKGKVTVKHPDKSVPGPTAKSIWKQAGLLQPRSSRKETES